MRNITKETLFFLAVVFFSAYNGLLLRALELPLAVVYLGVFFYSLTVLFAVMSLMARRVNNNKQKPEQPKPTETIPKQELEQQETPQITG